MKKLKAALKSSKFVRVLYSSYTENKDRTGERIQSGWDKLMWSFSKPAKPKTDGVYIHLGCGTINHPKMINVDLRPDKHIHYVHGVETLPMFDDNAADLIYVSHCLEHISYLELPKVLTEWRRVLKKGGVLRIAVPDFTTILEIYREANNDLEEILPPLMGGQDYNYNFHYSVFDHQYLKKMLEKTGFESVREWNKGDDEFTGFDDWANKNVHRNNKEYKISLNLQGVKAI